jgi:exodeoxyribonuclease V beta subunit
MKYTYNKKNLLNKLNFLSLIGKKYTYEDIVVPIMKPSKMIKFIMDKYELIDESTLRLLEHSFKYKTLIDFVYDIDNFDEELPQNEVKGIQILTVHKSKGLEFENVIVLDVLGGIKPTYNELLFDYDGIKLKDIKKSFKNRELVDDEYKEVLEKEKLLEYEDNKNAEYVAFTRPKNSLFIIKKSKKSKFVSNLTPQKKGKFKNDSEEKNKEKSEKFDLELRNYGKQEYKEIEEKEYKPNDYDAIYFGLATHYAFECENLDAVQNRYGEFCDTKKAFELFIEGKKLLPQGDKIYKEYPFLYDEQKGIIDLLIENEDEIIIVDYKTHTPEDERGYIKQIKRYKTAMEALKNRPVKGYIFYLDKMEMKEI